MNILFTHIKELLQTRPKSEVKVMGDSMKDLPHIKNAFLRIQGDTILDFGSMADVVIQETDEVIDVTGRIILPSWCDSHSHVVYAGDRSQEFVDRLNGLSYEDIAAKGGGILNSAQTLQATSEEALFEQSMERVNALIQLGTGALEIKSGYGLSPEAELKMLRVIKAIKGTSSLKIKATFLGAHAIPKLYKTDKQAYIDLIINTMLPEIHRENLADFVDVFCEKGYFSVDDTEQILKAAMPYGLVPKIHVNQFNAFGGVGLGVKYKALSVDHLEILNQEDIDVLKNSNTIPVALPGCSFFLGIPYTPARKLIDSGMALALASDYNPGSSPSGNMNFVVSLACIKMNMTPEEAINAATLNGAYAMDISEEYGSITTGKKANLIITKNMTSYRQIPYHFGNNPIHKVMINGEFVN
ncbi:MAG: imidazolonepropionase [Flavobacteriaceae bacterium]|jgi:imidazolonepropionase|nr:imidazolonepropionase [Flavobacteriaceae bacterium]MDA7727693.1 imidazolonepropionase [Flavobacteriaceae bacterium]MDA7849516.1 imidazolonepropionase [Flavobacteriaceae bacterium]MDB0004041.1 imidazolonepropionase [Flavobacteriaceae bacterium]MDG1309781.1 imidazolonepropionase [Flavobacteriaceae bacterium]